MENNLTKVKIGNNLYTNIIFKNFSNKLISDHLNTLELKFIDWSINSLDQNILLAIFSSLEYLVRIKIYTNLLFENLVKLLSNLDFFYLEEYTTKLGVNYKILINIFDKIDKKYYNNMLTFLKKSENVYIELLKLLNKNNKFYYYLIDNFPIEYYKNTKLFDNDILLRKLIMNKTEYQIKELLLNYPKNKIVERISNFEEVDLNFITMILGISNIYYAPKFFKYFSYFTFEEMKVLIHVLYPCYIIQLSELKEMNLTLYLNLVPYMSYEQIRFLLSNCNIGLFSKIFNKLKKDQIFQCINILDKSKFWISLKSVSFNDLLYFIDGMDDEQNNNFINSAVGLISNEKIFLSLLPQFQIVCFKFRRTFEIVVKYWDSIENYLTTFIIKLLNGKKLLILSEYCLTSEWGNLIEYIDKYQIKELENSIMNLLNLDVESNNTYNLISFCKYYKLENCLDHMNNLLI
jgi:hypothetical protein